MQVDKKNGTQEEAYSELLTYVEQEMDDLGEQTLTVEDVTDWLMTNMPEEADITDDLEVIYPPREVIQRAIRALRGPK